MSRKTRLGGHVQANKRFRGLRQIHRRRRKRMTFAKKAKVAQSSRVKMGGKDGTTSIFGPAG